MSVHSIRVRLTAWYAVVLAVTLFAVDVVTYAVAARQIERSVDAAIVSTARNVAAGLADETAEGGGALPVHAAIELLDDFRENDLAIVLLEGDGNEFAANQTPFAKSLDRTLLRQRVIARDFHLTTINNDAVRLYLAPTSLGGRSFVIVIAQSRAPLEQTLRTLRNAMLATAPIALLVACLGGYLLARKSLAPVARMSEQARTIGATNLAQRIEVAEPRDELGALAATLNELLARLERAFADQRRFMADASHELRTPVAILQGELDVTLSRDDRDAADYRESLAVMQRSVRRLTRIVRDLFLLARSDAGEVPLRRNPLYLGDLVAQTTRAYRNVAAEREVTLIADCEHDLVVDGDEDLLQRMLGNLVENAIRHTARGTSIAVSCTSDGERAQLKVRDHGAGIPSELHERVFERFFRVDAARGAAAGGGAGLGLSIARWIAEAHGGALRVERSDSSGSVFVAELPRSSSDV